MRCSTSSRVTLRALICQSGARVGSDLHSSQGEKTPLLKSVRLPPVRTALLAAIRERSLSRTRMSRMTPSLRSSVSVVAGAAARACAAVASMAAITVPLSQPTLIPSAILEMQQQRHPHQHAEPRRSPSRQLQWNAAGQPQPVDQVGDEIEQETDRYASTDEEQRAAQPLRPQGEGGGEKNHRNEQQGSRQQAMPEQAIAHRGKARRFENLDVARQLPEG